jgi:hypothetical protein
MRTGVSASRIPRKPSLLWVTEVGPTVSSIFANDTIENFNGLLMFSRAVA